MGERHGLDDEGCREAVARLYWFLDGELTTERRAAIQHHLDECSDCIEAYEFELELRVAIARGCRETVPEALRLRVYKALAGEQPGPAI
jgi:mycothiol system anti-sigma-R factor